MNLSQVVVENSLLLSSIIIKENDHIVLLAEEEEGLRGIKNFGNKKNFGIKSFGITFPLIGTCYCMDGTTYFNLLVEKLI